MIGKFINPIVSGGAPPTPSAAGIYIGGPFISVSYGSDSSNFNGIGLFNSDFTVDNSVVLPAMSMGAGSSRYIYNIVEQPDGKILIGGNFPSVNNQMLNTLRIIRLNSDFTLDSTFNGLASSGVIAIALQSDGKILIGGFFTSYGGVSINRIARLNSDGTLDASFIVGTGFSSTVHDIKVQSDGKILVSGNYTSYNGTTVNRLIRLETDGSIDATFNIGSGFNNRVNKIALQPDGKIFAVGNFSSFNGSVLSVLGERVRLNTDGSLDSSFNPNDAISGELHDVKILSDGSILVVGSVATTVGIRKYSSSGVTDTTFNNNVNYSSGQPSNFAVFSVEISQDDKLILSGSFGAFQGQVSNNFVVLNQDGTIFKTSPIISLYGQFESSCVLSSGKILFGGFVFPYTSFESNSIDNIRNVVKLSNYNTLLEDYYIRRLTSLSIGLSSSTLPKIHIDNSDNLYITDNSFSSYGTWMSKYDSVGKTINNFNGGYSVFNNHITDFASTQDGGTIFIGDFTLFKGELVNRIIKLGSDGLPDSTFMSNVGSGFSSSSNRIIVGNDQKIYVAGAFSNYNGVPNSGFVRLNSDGTRDSSFIAITNSKSSPYIRKLLLQNDGKLIVLGYITAYNSVTVNGVVRLNSDGTLDTSFNGGGTRFSELSITFYPETGIIQSDGKIVIGGRFNLYDGNPVSGIVRLNPDGSFDNTFNQGVGFLGTDSNQPNTYPVVYDMAELSDGKIIIVGNFVNYNGNIAKGYCVLDSDGNFIESNIYFYGFPTSIFIKQ